MIEYIMLIIALFSFALLFIAIIFTLRLKRFEDSRIINIENIFAFGLFFLLFHVGITALNYLNQAFHGTLLKISQNIPAYIEVLSKIDNFAFVPVFAVCLLAGMLALREI